MPKRSGQRSSLPTVDYPEAINLLFVFASLYLIVTL